jgi:hypothetical protein
MAVTYQFLGETNAIAYESSGYVVMKKYIDFADLILNPQKLALASAPNTPLSAFAGFVGASSDILQVFHVPAGFHVLAGGSYIQAAATATTATFTLGDGDSTAGLQLATALDGVSGQWTLNDDAYGGDYMTGKSYIVADTIDMLFATATPVDGKVHVWAIGFKCFDLLGADV